MLTAAACSIAILWSAAALAQSPTETAAPAPAATDATAPGPLVPAPSSAPATPQAAPAAEAPAAEAHAAEPFAFGDFTWLNGNSRQHKPLLDTPYFTGSFLVDVNYTVSDNLPRDHTIVGSTALARDNEFTLSFLGFGGDFHYQHARGRLMTQFGLRSTVVPRNDGSVNRGQFNLDTALRYVSEAYGGYHADVWNGINIDVGIFMSYIGLFSYDNFDNWAYQPSFTSDNTPWFFNGIRVQTFPSDKLKVEFWLINGWQTYGKFNETPGAGVQLLWRPIESFSVLSNDYFGFDTVNKAGRLRVHSDNSAQYRYFHQPKSFLDRAAFSVTADLGFEQGEGVTAFGGSGGPEQNFISAMAYHRVWFNENHFGWTFGGGFIHNPGRYLVLLPTGEAGKNFDTSLGTKFDGWDASTTLDWMPDEYQTWRLEFVHRSARIPYFAGHGGVTSPDGYATTPVPAGWAPDQVKSENRIVAAFLLRL